jgi:hypothetical protein
VARKKLLSGRLLAIAFLLILTSAGCRGSHQGEDEASGVWFVHASDPHIFIPIFIPAAEKPETEEVGKKQEALNEKALSDLFRRIGSQSGYPQPVFLVLTGDLGVDPCAIPQQKAAPAGTSEDGKPGSTTGNAREPTIKVNAADCVSNVDTGKRKEQVERLAKIFALSSLRHVYLVAGNNDVARESPGDAALTYYNKFIDEVQAKTAMQNSSVELHNLTRCYVAGEPPSACYADILDTSYRFVGFPSYSYKNQDGEVDNAAQAKQFEVFRGLLDQADKAGKKVLIVTHTPEIDDPFILAQDRYAGKTPPAATDPDPKNTRSTWSSWNVSKKLLDDWNKVLISDSVAGVLAGHLHDPHKEIYRQPYRWSSLSGRQGALRKLFLAPPLAIKNQENSPVQARGFSLVHLEADRIERELYWYDSETGLFSVEQRLQAPAGRHRRMWLQSATSWLWELDHTDHDLERMAVLLIALLTAFLTVVAIWQIPASDTLLTNQVVKAQSAAETATDNSPFATRFGKTVIAGLAGLAATEVVKSLGNQPSSSDSKWYYVVWFIVSFFLLLFVLNGVRAFAEALRARVAIVHYPLARVAHLRSSSAGRLGDWAMYWALRALHWLFLLKVPLLTLFDTFLNLIQGKNQTTTRAFADTIVRQQSNVVHAADAVRENLTELIGRKVMEGRIAAKELAHRGVGPSVRVAISVLSEDQSNAFYISRAPGSSLLPFTRRSLGWISVFTGQIRWFQSKYRALPDWSKIVLFDNRAGTITDEDPQILLSTHYQDRQEDYHAFVILPVPWPQRGFGTDYVKGAIHISFREDVDLEYIWNANSIVPSGGPPPIYQSPHSMVEDWCTDVEVRAALRTSMAVLGELLAGFNEVIYKSYIEQTSRTETSTT